MITYKDSVTLAEKLMRLSPAIQGVELFGSVIHNRYGRDADFLVLVDDELASSWWEQKRELIRVRWPDAFYGQRWIVKKFIPFAYRATVHKRRQKRFEDSITMLGINPELLQSRQNIPDFEVFLVPVNWRIGTELNMSAMRRVTDLIGDKNTLGFLKRIARDAVPVTVRKLL